MTMLWVQNVPFLAMEIYFFGFVDDILRHCLVPTGDGG